MDYQTLSYAVDEGVATITLNRPDSLNAMSPAMAKELNDAALRVDGDTAVRAVVLTGTGKAFCAGGDFGAEGSACGSDTGGDVAVCAATASACMAENLSLIHI